MSVAAVVGALGVLLNQVFIWPQVRRAITTVEGVAALTVLGGLLAFEGRRHEGRATSVDAAEGTVDAVELRMRLTDARSAPIAMVSPVSSAPRPSAPAAQWATLLRRCSRTALTLWTTREAR